MNLILIGAYMFIHGQTFSQEAMNEKTEKVVPSDNHRIINGRSINKDCEVINGKWTCQAIEIKRINNVEKTFFMRPAHIIFNQLSSPGNRPNKMANTGLGNIR